MHTITKEKILQELGDIAFASATDLVRVEGGNLFVADTGDLTEEQARAIASVEKAPGGLKVKFYDKLKALELLLRARGELDFGHTPGDSGLLKAILSATKGNLDGVQDIQPQAAGGDDLVEQGKPEDL